jgi:hypothetical protein
MSFKNTIRSLIPFLTLFFLLGSGAYLSAQRGNNPPPGGPGGPGGFDRQGPEGRPNIEALKVAYMTKNLNLTAEEAQQFWPNYNAYGDELKKTRRENNDNELAFEEKALAVRKKYYTLFKKALGTDERANAVFKAEKNFNSMVRKELMNRRQGEKREN